MVQTKEADYLLSLALWDADDHLWRFHSAGRPASGPGPRSVSQDTRRVMPCPTSTPKSLVLRERRDSGPTTVLDSHPCSDPQPPMGRDGSVLVPRRDRVAGGLGRVVQVLRTQGSVLWVVWVLDDRHVPSELHLGRVRPRNHVADTYSWG